MFKRYLVGLTMALALGFAAVPQQSQAQTQPMPNWFDPSTWMATVPGAGVPAQGYGVPQFNLAHPSGWAQFLSPNTYGAFMNPATYGQFMQPQWWMQFANPNNMMAWMNPAAYGAFMNPASYMQWMNPGAYAQFMNPAAYMQWMNPGAYGAFMNPATYMQWMNPAAYTIPTGAVAAGAGVPTFNWFDPNSWTQMMPQQAPAAGAAPAAPADANKGKK